MKDNADLLPLPRGEGSAMAMGLDSVDEIKEALDEGEFSPEDACYILAFFIRHGIVTFENEENYTKILGRLHRSLGVHTLED